LFDGVSTDPKAVDAAREQASQWLRRLGIPPRLWGLPPATFSGGEQQRINIARNMIKPKPLLLLDEPTASLDEANVHNVVELIAEARNAGTAVLGIFHDERVRSQVATRRVNMAEFRG
jgi:alpha-D-ribose 1-methylphosphonate 5-triphosphate synthase subunit PhnL